MGYDDFVCVLKDRQQNHSEATAHGRKCKLKAFFRWESGDKDDWRVRNITSGSYVSPVTLDDLLTEDEIRKLREAAKRMHGIWLWWIFICCGGRDHLRVLN